MAAVRTVVFYISGHGFGHASRQIEIINTVTARQPNLDVRSRSDAPPWLFDRSLDRRDVPVVPGACDTGVVQVDSLHIDETASIDRASAFYDDLEAHADREADFSHAALRS